MRKFFLIFLLFTFSLSYANEEVFDDESKLISGLKSLILKQTTKLTSPKNEEDEKSNKKKTIIPKKKESFKPNELIVDLRNPSYINGILTTHEGGVIKGEDIRIQAKTIQYIKRVEKGKPVHKIEADGDLMIQHNNKIYVGDELEYNFITKTGTIFEGKTFAAPWYLGGDKIDLFPDGNYTVKNVFITTCENRDSSWDIHAGSVSVKDKNLLKAKRVRFRFFKFPAFWLPSFKVNLKKFMAKPLIKYKVNWDKSSGPRAGIRYQLYSWKEFCLFARLDYRLNMGWGGAIETEYYPENQKTKFETKNYLASDVIPKDLKKKRRYRVQGVYHSISPTEKTTLDITWDKFSDIRMPSDFKSDDFELNTAKRTELIFRHEENELLGIFYARPRLNPFFTVKQEIPSFYVSMRPFQIPYANIISYNYVKTSYLDYSYSDKLSPSLQDFHSARLEAHQELYRPIYINSFTFTPFIGVHGIYYNNNPLNSASVGQGLILYGGKFNTHIYRKFKRHKHIIEPYLVYKGISTPTRKVDQYYVFSIQDGYNRLNQMQIGLKNQIFSIAKNKSMPSLDIDLYTNLFFASNTIPSTIPKVYLDLKWNLPSLYFLTQTAWNIHYNILDFSNLRLGWTVNRDVAFTLEFRYRSPYDWRKANHDNFILDVSRTEDTLRDSPISDKRNTILTHAFLRLNPYWTCHIESHHGWNRYKEPFYNEYKFDLFTMLSTSWKVRLSYQHTTTDDRFSGAIFLIK